MVGGVSCLFIYLIFFFWIGIKEMAGFYLSMREGERETDMFLSLKIKGVGSLSLKNNNNNKKAVSRGVFYCF